MCGIAGIAAAGPRPDRAVLERMAATMVHRGPDGQGTWAAEGIGLAFRRLAIIDLHERSNQPLHLDRWHLVFNGEIYNYPELRDELRELGHAFETEGDGEVLLHAWAQWGRNVFDRLDGMFAFAVWDDAARSLTLATDPFAEKPLLYARRPAGLVFGSDIRALIAADPGLGAPRTEAVERFLALGTMPALPETFFAGVERLRGSHFATWRDGHLHVERYWTPRPLDVPTERAAAAEALRELLTRSVARRLRSDVPVGTSLSGGVDSSAIVGLSAALAGEHRRHAFTARFPGFQRDEWRYAEEAGRMAGVIEHHPVEPTADELLVDLAALVRDQQEPFVTTSIYAQWRVMRAARAAGVIVLLDGQGADELFGGYPGLAGLALRSQGLGTALRTVAGDRSLAGPLARALLAGRVPAALAHRERLRSASPYVPVEAARAAADHDPPGGGGDLRRELLRQTFTTSLPDLLRYADRDSMAHSVEVRLPFLDRRVAEFALSLPASALYAHPDTKRVLRDAVQGVVPASILARREKVGFETPEADWFAEPAVRRRFGQLLLDPAARTAKLLDRAEVKRDMAEGAWRDDRALWRAVCVELWLAEFA